MIINSLLDIDYNKLVMMQFAYLNYKDVEVEYRFENSNMGDKISSAIDEPSLATELDIIKQLSFTEEEIEWVASQKHQSHPKVPVASKTFKPEFIEYLKEFSLSDYILTVNEDEEYKFSVKGTITEVIIWETLFLSLINEAYYITKYQNRDQFVSNGTINNFELISSLSPHKGLKVFDGGTKVRFGLEWQRNIVEVCKDTIGGFVGSTNCKISMDNNIDVKFTDCLDIIILSTGIHRSDMKGGQEKIMSEWYKLYGKELSIVPTDAYTTDNFFENATPEVAENWNFSCSSGDPYDFMEKILTFYKDNKVDSRKKTAIINKDLPTKDIIKLNNIFGDVIKIEFALSYLLTNNVGIKKLNINLNPYKLISNGECKLAKITDDMGNSFGDDETLSVYLRELF